jgi:sulfite reductase (ferredoxin)
MRTNVRAQRQDNYSMVEVVLPLGDITADQLRGVASIARRFVGRAVRTTVSQNLLLRWVSNDDLPEVYRALDALGLGRAGAGRLSDVTACPGTDSCKLGITSSRGLAAVLDQKLGNGMADIADREDITVKISGCFNSCGQHHIADIGFLGSVQRKGAYTAPVFQVVLGGSMRNNASSYGMVTAKVPARHVPEVTAKLTRLYASEKADGETFQDFVARLGKARLKEELSDFELPAWEDAPELYTDNRQNWAYHKETGVGECAGEVVDQAEFMLEDADRLVFEATLALDEGRFGEAARGALEATERAADALLSTRGLLLSDRYDRLAEFRSLFYETGQFHRPFADNFFRAAAEEEGGLDPDGSRRRVEEAALFLEQAQTVYSRA